MFSSHFHEFTLILLLDFYIEVRKEKCHKFQRTVKVTKLFTWNHMRVSQLRYNNFINHENKWKKKDNWNKWNIRFLTINLDFLQKRKEKDRGESGN
jgi:hypothetical protein